MWLVYSVHSFHYEVYTVQVYSVQRTEAGLQSGVRLSGSGSRGQWLTDNHQSHNREGDQGQVSPGESEACRTTVIESISRRTEIRREHFLTVLSELSCWENSQWIIDDGVLLSLGSLCLWPAGEDYDRMVVELSKLDSWWPFHPKVPKYMNLIALLDYSNLNTWVQQRTLISRAV